jgi:hypothetical protein
VGSGAGTRAQPPTERNIAGSSTQSRTDLLVRNQEVRHAAIRTERLCYQRCYQTRLDLGERAAYDRGTTEMAGRRRSGPGPA